MHRPARHAARRRALHRDQQPHRRHAGADRRRARRAGRPPASTASTSSTPRSPAATRTSSTRSSRCSRSAAWRRREYAEGTLRQKLFGQGDRLPERHPAARYRGAFAPVRPVRCDDRGEAGERATTKRLILNLFEMNCVSHITHGLWRLPDNNRERFNDIEYWTELARLLEAGGFDAVFLADVVGTYDTFRGSADTAIRQGLQIPNNDPAVVVPAMAAVTKHLGFGITFSTTYEPPFAWARRASTLDHLTKGRVGWNIVTSYLPNAARNHGLDGEVEHDNRFETRRRVPRRPLQAVGGLLGRRRDHRRPRAQRVRRPGEDPPDRPRRHLLQGRGTAPALTQPAAHARAVHRDPVGGRAPRSPASTPRSSSPAGRARSS